jgi:hypothetical protein
MEALTQTVKTTVQRNQTSEAAHQFSRPEAKRIRVDRSGEVQHTSKSWTQSLQPAPIMAPTATPAATPPQFGPLS